MSNFIVFISTLLIIGIESRCTLPPQPNNGRWKVLNGNGKPGGKVEINSILQFSCNKGFRLTKHPHVICIREWDEQDMPMCEKLCPPLYTSSTTTVTCTDKLKQSINCTETTDGSSATFECIPFYEVPLGFRRTIFCLDGIWNYPKPQCQPVCGKKIDVKKLIFGGQLQDKLVYPWIVAIYMKENGRFTNICGGTIIAPNVVLTAAHCVTNEYAEPHSPCAFQVAAAKLYNKYGDPRDKNSQYLEVATVIVHSQYKGESRRFLGDIALLITDKPFKLGSLVQPACINNLNNVYLHTGLSGEIAGWGITEDGVVSDELRAIEIPYKSEVLCSAELPEEWAEKYNLLDKICAGYPQKQVSVCKGDSGSGLVFKNFEDGRYYVHGVVSLAPFSKGTFCNTVNSALYTKVTFYYQFIETEISRISGCKLPAYPKNGKWILSRDPLKVPGSIVPSDEILTFMCDPGYKLTTSRSTFDCDSLISIAPSCQYTGAVGDQYPPDAPSQSEGDDDNFPENEGTNDETTPFTPAEGVDEFLEKVDCGKKVNGSATKSSNVTHSDYPWLVGIYRKRQFRGIGSLLSKRVIVTTAYTVTQDRTANPLSPQNIKVGVGKFYKYFWDPRDVDAKYLDVSNVVIFEGYEGISSSLYGDIAVVVTKQAVEFNQWVSPVCIKDLDKLQIPEDGVGELSGWSDKVLTEADILHSLKINYKSTNQCIKETPRWVNFLSPDLICGSTPNHTVFNFDGDGGSGLVVKNPQNSRYYVYGILGWSGLPSGASVLGDNSGYICLKPHYNFILSNIRRFG